MNQAIYNGVLKLIGFACTVAGVWVIAGLGLGLVTAGVLLLAAAALPFRRRGERE